MCIIVQIKALLEVRVTYVSTCWQESLCPWAVRATGEVGWSEVPHGRMWSWWHPASLCARSAAHLVVRAPRAPLGPALIGTTLCVSVHRPSKTVVSTHSPPPTAQTDIGLLTRWYMKGGENQLYTRELQVFNKLVHSLWLLAADSPATHPLHAYTCSRSQTRWPPALECAPATAESALPVTSLAPNAL